MNIYYMPCIGGSHCNVSLHSVSHTIMGNTEYKQVKWLHWPVYIYIYIYTHTHIYTYVRIIHITTYMYIISVYKKC